MAFDYTTNPTGVFYRGGKVIKYINSHLANATTTLPAELKAIADPFESADMTDQIATLFGVYTGMQNQEVTNRQSLASFWDRILADRTSVLNQLSLTSGGISEVIPALIRQMITDSATVQKITTTVGSVTAAAGNTGNGTVLLTKKLDGATPPMSGALVIPQYANLDSELATNETMTFTCERDSGRDRLTEGAEQFSWLGKIADAPFGWNGDGSGRGPTLTVGNGNAIETDGEFENWGGTGNNTPSNWTIDNGTAGTHILRESTTIYRGTYAMQFLGTGAQATIGVSQSASSTGMNLRGKKMYLVTVRMRCDSAPAAGTFNVQFSGTGYSPGAGESISVAFGSMPTSYTLYSFFAVMPATPPSDFRLVVQVTGTLSNTRKVYVDTLHVNEVPYHGGIGAVVVAGSIPFVVGDRFTSAITESAETVGVFNRFFRRKYKAQLPSSGSPSISDSLGT